MIKLMIMNRFLSACFFIVTSLAAVAQTEVVADSISDKFIFERVETEAAFPGGIDAWIQFLQKKLNPNVPVDHGAPIGKYTVYVQFVVDKEGNIKEVTPLT